MRRRPLESVVTRAPRVRSRSSRSRLRAAGLSGRAEPARPDERPEARPPPWTVRPTERGAVGRLHFDTDRPSVLSLLPVMGDYAYTLVPENDEPP